MRDLRGALAETETGPEPAEGGTEQ